MGQPDLYPFDPSPNVLEKVAFIHDILHPAQEGGRAALGAVSAAGTG